MLLSQHSNCVGSIVRAKGARPSVDTCYICPQTAEHSGKTDFCSGFAAHSVCSMTRLATCYTPSDCKFEGRDGHNDVVSHRSQCQFFESVRSQSVEALVDRLSAPGEELDEDVPQYFKCLVAEVARGDQDDREPTLRKLREPVTFPAIQRAELAATGGHRGGCMNRARVPPGK